MTDLCKPISARITNFCCFDDSGELPLDDRITVLIAENENGKTSALRALAWFGTSETLPTEDLWDGAARDAVLPIVAVTYRVSSQGKKELQEAGYGAPDEVTITKDSAGQFSIADARTVAALDTVKRQQSLTTLIAKLRAALPDGSGYSVDVQRAIHTLHGLLGQTFDPELAETQLSEIRRYLGDILPELTPPANEAVTQALRDIGVWETARDTGAQTIITRLAPTFIFFDDLIGEIPDSVAYDEIAADPAAHLTIRLLADLAGIEHDLATMAELSWSDRERLDKTASASLSDQANKYWHQDKIECTIRLDTDRVGLLIEHKGRKGTPSRKSRGLKWFLNFYIHFRGLTNGELRNAILLLDEPGLVLHIKQQWKLLELFEQIAHENQIVYTTHLPHLIPAYHLNRLRILESDPETSTVKVVGDIRRVESGADVLKPVREAIGMDIASPVSLGSTTVIVEGEADQVLLHAMSNLCRNKGRPCLDDDVTLFPAGGAGMKMVTPAAFIASGMVKGVVLVDDDSGGRAAMREIEKAHGDRVTVVKTHPGDESGLELEDLFPRDYYTEAVNEGHRTLRNFIPLDAALIAAETTPVLDAIDAKFRQSGGNRKGRAQFQKLRAARALERRVQKGDPPSDETLNAFADLFARLNEALGHGAADEADVA